MSQRPPASRFRPRSRPWSLVALVALPLAVSSGCAADAQAPPAASPAAVSPPVAAAPPPAPASPSPPGAADLEARFAEREAFFLAQGQFLEDALPRAATPEQRAFVRALDALGDAPLTADEEAYWLALTLDACETAILNGHVLSAGAVVAYVQGSPLLARWEDPAERDQAIALMVEGTTYLCPDDTAAWASALDELAAGG